MLLLPASMPPTSDECRSCHAVWLFSSCMRVGDSSS
jgi:hypothetical protein